jgi:hypothetical protein
MASPTTEGNVRVNQGSGSSVNGAITTTGAADLIYVIVCTVNTASNITVTSVTATGLTFTRRDQLIDASAGKTVIEIWTAPASSALSAVTITANLSGTAERTIFDAFGVKDLWSTVDAFDGSYASDTTSAVAPATIAVTTSQAHDLLLYIAGGRGLNLNSTPPSGPSAGAWGSVSGGNNSTGPSSITQSLWIYTKSVSATQSGNITTNTAGTTPFIIVSAFTGDAKTALVLQTFVSCVVCS